MLLAFLTAVYVLCALFLAAYSVGLIVLIIAYLRHRRAPVTAQSLSAHPKVAVQLPIFNELYVVERLLDAVAALDYPRDALEVQVLDDSTDETVEITAAKVAQLAATGLNIRHIRRGSRAGYKAGALAYGMAQTDAEYVAVIDADFVPPPDFLQRMLPPFLANPRVGMVQARWGHLNGNDNLLTRGQALALDGHFIIEHTARNRSGWLMNFNGTCGVWRSSAIHDAGGWQDITLTEDLDLSYRAQLRGWQFVYLPDVVVPGELPPEIASYRQQQARWAKGGAQCLVMLLRPIWTSPRLSFMQRLMATMHLSQYLVHPVIITMLLLTPILLLADQMRHLPLGWMGLTGLAAPILYALSQRDLHPNWVQRMAALPALITLGTGIAWSNARAVVSGLFTQRGEFVRTPKQGSRKANRYSRMLKRGMMMETMLAVYALWGASLAVFNAPTLVPYLLLYGAAFIGIALWAMRDALRQRFSAS
jgi:cellulose synthase/poly-beta-1,6-N-acetylglucosamine synthase-like glycosyltransferase